MIKQFPKLYVLKDDINRSTVAEVSPGEFTHDGWPLKTENILGLIAEGRLVEIDI
jgi:hypothetical protein